MDIDPYDPRLISAPEFRTMLIAMIAKRDNYLQRKQFESARVAGVMLIVAWMSFMNPDADASTINTEIGAL